MNMSATPVAADPKRSKASVNETTPWAVQVARRSLVACSRDSPLERARAKLHNLQQPRVGPPVDGRAAEAYDLSVRVTEQRAQAAPARYSCRAARTDSCTDAGTCGDGVTLHRLSVRLSESQVPRQ